MKSFATLTAALVATTLPSLAAANSIFDIFKPRQAAPQSCHEGSVLCPGCDGSNITDGTGDLWTVTCDFAIEAVHEEAVAGDVTTSTCLDACHDMDECVGVTFTPNGTCVVAAGQQKGLSYSSGYTNLARLPPTPTASGVTTTKTSASSTSTSGECDLDGDEICPKCSGQVAIDSKGNAYRVLCDTSLNSNGSYSPQDWMSPEACLEECDKLDFCTGVTYNEERNCELAKAGPVTVSDKSFTAFLPLQTAAPTPAARSVTSQTSLSATTVGPTFSVLPINSGCNPSAVSCNECDGYQITDKLNGSYTAICAREAICLTTDPQGEGTQEHCLERCDQDVTCLAAMWSPDSLLCNLCLRGFELGTAAGDFPYVILAVDVDGKANDAITTSTTSVEPTSITTHPTTLITYLPAPYPTETSSDSGPTSTRLGSLPHSSNTTTSQIPSITPSQSQVICPASDNSVYVDPSSKNRYVVGCDNRFDAAHSAYTTAADFEACAAQCTASCDGFQFGASSRCGLYTHVTFIGPAEGWTVAARVNQLSTAMPYTATSFDVSAVVSARASTSATPSFTFAPTAGTFSYASPMSSAFSTSRRYNVTVAAQSPSMTLV